MGRCHHKSLSAPDVLIRRIQREAPPFGSPRSLGNGDHQAAGTSDVFPTSMARVSVAALAPMADAEDGELPEELCAWALGNPREEIDL